MTKITLTNILLFLDKKRLITIPDKLFLKLLYKKNIGKKLNFDNPKTFNEKLQWLKIYDRNPLYVKLVDKYEVRNYIKEKIGEEYLIPLIGVYNRFEDIKFELLPNQFVLKCTHDSGGVFVCKDKEKCDFMEMKNKVNKLLKRNFFYQSREWPYKEVKHKIIIEKYMQEDGKAELTDYKLMCFNGKVKCTLVCSDRNSKSGLRKDFYDTNWNRLPFQKHGKNLEHQMPKPENYELMVQLAEKLARDFKFLRVDLYEISGKIYFGELTLYPGAGIEKFEPSEWDEILGSWLEL